MRYTSPDKENTPEDILASTLFFAGALGCALRENEGVVVEAKNDLLKLVEPGKYSVWREENQIKIARMDEEHQQNPEIKEGTFLWIHKKGEDDE